MNESSTRDLMRSFTTDLPVGAAPVGAAIADGRHVRARRRIVAGVVAATVAAGTLATVALVDGSDERHDPIAPPSNSLSHSWWAAGTLYMSHGTVPLAGVRELVQIPGGVVVLTEPGEVRRVDDDGANRLIGHWRSGVPRDDLSPNVRAEDDGKVVWLDGTTTPEYSFVVYDPTSGEIVASHSIPTGGFHEKAWLNEFEDGVVVWDSPAYGQRAWDIATDEVTKIHDGGATWLISLENDVWITLDDKGVGTVAELSGRQLWQSSDSPGQLSPDGAAVLTGSYPPAQLHLRDALTGREIAGALDVSTGLGVRDYLDDGHQLSYVVGTEGPEGAVAPYDLVSCDLDSARCTTVVDDAAEQPVLPSD